MQCFLWKGWLSRKFLLRGRQTHKPTLVHCWFQLHKTFFFSFFLGSTHHKAVRRSCISFLSVSLTCAFCSQPHTNTQTHTCLPTLSETSTPCMDEASPSPLWNNPSASQLALLDFLWAQCLSQCCYEINPYMSGWLCLLILFT